jgi:hypothetical protein
MSFAVSPPAFAPVYSAGQLVGQQVNGGPAIPILYAPSLATLPGPLPSTVNAPYNANGMLAIVVP